MGTKRRNSRVTEALSIIYIHFLRVLPMLPSRDFRLACLHRPAADNLISSRLTVFKSIW
jgi:hypothetical protein